MAVQRGTETEIRAAEKAILAPQAPWWHQMRRKFTPVEVIGELIRVPGDGNCLFTAIAVAMCHSQGHTLPSTSAFGRFGACCREAFLKKLEEAVWGGATLEGLPMINAIIDVGDPPAEVGAHGPSELQPVESAGSRPAMAANSSTCTSSTWTRLTQLA